MVVAMKHCAICGENVKKVVEPRMGRYRGEDVQVTSEFFRCSACGEVYFSPVQLKHHNRAIKNEIRKKYGLLSAQRIVEIRKKLKLTQEELEELLDTGAKVVVRWESGKVIQPTGQDSLLRLLDREPRMVDHLRKIQASRSREQKKYHLAV